MFVKNDKKKKFKSKVCLNKKKSIILNLRKKNFYLKKLNIKKFFKIVKLYNINLILRKN